MKKFLMAPVVLFMVSALSCNGSVKTDSDTPTPSTIGMIKVGTSVALSNGFATLVKRNVENRETMVKTANTTRETVTAVILPMLNGASTTDCTKELADKALVLLDGKVLPEVKIAIQTGINLVLENVKLPENPTEKLSAKSKAYIIAFFDGVVLGCDSFVAGQVESADSLPRGMVEKLEWSKK